MRARQAKLSACAALALAVSCTAPARPGAFIALLDRPTEVMRLADLAKAVDPALDRAPPGGPADDRSESPRPEARGPRYGAARIALLWRSDCAPCVAELQYFDRLERAAGRDRLVTIALEPADQARATLLRLGVKPHPAYAAVGEPQAFLEAVSGGRRLPSSIALDHEGGICARHVGLLGLERARAWSARC